MNVVETVKTTPRKKRIRKRIGAESNRGRDGQATAFRQVETIQFFIDRLTEDKYRAIALLCYYCVARVDAVTHLRAKDIRQGAVHFVSRTAKTKTHHTVELSGALERGLDDCSLRASGYLFPPAGARPNRDRNQYTNVKTTEEERAAFRKKHGYDGPKSKTIVKQRKIRPCLSTQAVDNALCKIRAELCENPPDSLRMQILLLPEIYSRHAEDYGPMPQQQWAKALAQAHEVFWGFSSHSFRRSMCMHLFYEQSWPAPKVMGVSGHKSLDSFYKYVGYSTKVAQADYAKLFA